MGGLDAPGLRIEVVGAIADILHWAESETLVGHSNDTARRISRQHNCLATKVAEGLGVGEIRCWC